MQSEQAGQFWTVLQSLTLAECAPLEAREEAQQIQRAQRGDRHAIDWLIAQYRQRAVRLATHILRNPSEAEDVAQEAFIRAFRSLASYRGEGRFSSWLHPIVVRLCMDRLRSARWRSEVALPPSLVLERATTPEHETRLLVESLLDRLSPPMRAVLVLRELEGMEYAEIAQILNIPLGRVRWRLHEAREQFRVLWESVLQEADHV